MGKKTFSQAVNEAIREEMLRDQNVFLMGQDLRSRLYGPAGLLGEELGADRVLDTPISEAVITGAAIGAAAVGMRPIMVSFASMMWVAMDQLVSQAAKMRYMFGGQVKLPVVFRLMEGGASAAHHSDRPHGLFMNMPGLKIAVPSAPSDAKGLLKAAIRGDDPVLFFENGSLFGTSEEVPEGDYIIPFGTADVKRGGTDLTVVAIGAMVPIALKAAERLLDEGVSVEVIDPRTLVPLDKQSILKSVAKTGRLVVVDSGPRTGGAASEIASVVADEGFWHLRAPIKRVTAPDVHVPFSPPLVKLLYPDEEKITQAARSAFE